MDTIIAEQVDHSIAGLDRLNEFDNHEFVIRLHDKPSGLKAFVGIHNTNMGVASGGTRMIRYANEEAAVRDVLKLSKAMSYKCALARLPFGGGKAVIMLDESKSRDAVLFSYGRLLEKLHGSFKTGTDVGVTDEDMRKIATKTSHILGVSHVDRKGLTTSGIAALGVFSSMKAVLRQLYGHEDFNGVRIAIKGVGKLGGELTRLTSEAGAHVIIADVNNNVCQKLAEKYKDVRIVATEDIHRQQAEIYAPCALGDEFTEEVISQLRCKAIAGGANNQLPDPIDGKLIQERGILYAPDYVSNAGGLIYVSDELEPGGFNVQRVISRAKDIQVTMRQIFRESAAQGLPTNYVADAIAIKRISEAANV